MNHLVLSLKDFPEGINHDLDLVYRQIRLEETKQALKNATDEKIALLQAYVEDNPDKFGKDEFARELATFILSYHS